MLFSAGRNGTRGGGLGQRCSGLSACGSKREDLGTVLPRDDERSDRTLTVRRPDLYLLLADGCNAFVCAQATSDLSLLLSCGLPRRARYYSTTSKEESVYWVNIIRALAGLKELLEGVSTD